MRHQNESSFDRVQHRLRELAGIHAALNVGICDVGPEEDLPKRGHKIVDTLDVSAGRVTDGPDV